jgi:radical SAM protein with 4Fe4S-binding SPASM domain
MRDEPLAGSARTPCFGEPFVLQWHLTDQCNLSCRHCYRSGPQRTPIASREHRAVIDAFASFCRRRGLGGRIHIAGGEPTASRDLLPAIRAAAEHGLRCRVLSNGTMVTAAMAAELRDTGCLGVQVSIEGAPDRHDWIRGHGSFDASMRGARLLRGEGVPVTFAMTLHADNHGDIDAVAGHAAEGADRLYFSRLVPIGRGGAVCGVLTARQWEKAIARILSLAERGRPPVAIRDPTFRPFLAMPQGAACAQAIAGCSAGFNTLTLEADGTFMPCRRLAIDLGRLGDTTFDEVYDRHPVLESLRRRDSLRGACGRCVYRWVCGGCRAIPHALSGDMMGEDPQCPWGRRMRSRILIRARHRWRWMRAHIRGALARPPF